jgi:predicted RNA-binding Zn-ribbon protein involved in translation (DUF1610 family)
MFWNKKSKVEKVIIERKMPLCGNIELHYSFEDNGLYSFPCPACGAIKDTKRKQKREDLEREKLADLIAEKVLKKLAEQNITMEK